MSRYLGWWILDENKSPVRASNNEYESWMGSARESREEWKKRKQVAMTEVAGFNVSTVFLAMDHGYEPDGEPILFETMIFGTKEHGQMGMTGATATAHGRRRSRATRKSARCLKVDGSQGASTDVWGRYGATRPIQHSQAGC